MPYSKGACYTIYAYSAPDGRMYIGKTGLQQGARAGANGAGYKHCKRFWSAIQHYGWEAFHYQVLATVCKGDDNAAQKACDLEANYIKQYQTTDIRFGFNMCATDSPKSYRKLAEVRKNRRIVNKDGIIRQVADTEFARYLANGWKPGYNRIS